MYWGASIAHGAPVDIALGSGRLGASALGLFSFTLSANVGSNDSLILSTSGSSFDTEIAVFDRHGLLIATNDDISPSNSLSELRFGSEKALPAGDYSVILSGFNTIFRDGNIIPGSSQGETFSLISNRPSRLQYLRYQLTQQQMGIFCRSQFMKLNSAVAGSMPARYRVLTLSWLTTCKAETGSQYTRTAPDSIARSASTTQKEGWSPPMTISIHVTRSVDLALVWTAIMDAAC